MAILHNVVEELNSELPRTNPDSSRVEDLNQGPPDFKSNALNHSTTLPLSDKDNSVSQTDNFVIVIVFNSVTSSGVTGNRDFAKQEELIYETIAALTSNTTCPMPAILGESTCTVLPSDFYGAKIHVHVPFP